MFRSLLNYHTPLEKKLEKLTGLKAEALPNPIRALHNPATCPKNLLPWLAWERSVDFWRDDWSEQIKRDVIAASVGIHRKKGTVSAVKQAIAATGVLADIAIDRSSPTYVPHTYSVAIDADQYIPSPQNAIDIRYQVDHTQATRCNYDVRYQAKFDAEKNNQETTLISRTLDPNIDHLNHKDSVQTEHYQRTDLQSRYRNPAIDHLAFLDNATAPKQQSCAIFTRIREAV